uniref:Coiled-coil domain containing 141 n=1 Tax=Kryptolebias marmoratus TaxID=37003 RepID=A0A3Q3BGX8_KRYMA
MFQVSGSGQNLGSVEQRAMQRLDETENELQTHQQMEIQQDQEDEMFCRRNPEKLMKTLQDLKCVSELLDSCTRMDLGSDPQTSRLLERFKQAEPHFRQLDSEVDHMLQNRDSLRGVPVQIQVQVQVEEGLSELLKLRQTVKDKIHQSESILNLTRSFHLTANQLDLLLQSEPTRTSTELSQYQEARQQIQNLLKTTLTLKTDICTTVTQTGSAGFRVEQLEARLGSLDSLCESWLKEAAGQEEKLPHLLNDDIIQLRGSFKELKKRFSNSKFNFLKRNDRTRNTKAVRNQLQQVEIFQEKLQALRKRVHSVSARLGSEVKDGAVARQVEDAANELQRQMGEFERNVCEHQKTLDLTCRLQLAIEEHQFWYEEASATIARVGKFSLECRVAEAASVLFRQFEKFVWPTVPQQEERIRQITELAVRLHGVEEGQRYIEKMVSKHSEMVESIRQLSHKLMKLEAKLKLQSLKQQQNDEEKEVKEDEDEERSREEEKKEKRKKIQKELKDNRSSQEAADMHELKETGHTPELTAKHDGKESSAANRKGPLKRSEEADRGTVDSESSMSCSPLEANRLVHTIHSQSQLVTTETQATSPLSIIGPFCDVQKEFEEEIKEEQQAASDLNPLQNASAHAEFQQHEAMMEDFLSNDEYDCASPDDISLPPLAETPESNMFQSDIEDGFCFSSHSIHVSQFSHQSHPQAELTGTGPGAVPQQAESCPTPPVSLHSSTRFRSESRSFLQSPSTVPAPRLFTSTLCTILKTRESSTNNQSADLDNPEPRPPPGSNPVYESNAPHGSGDTGFHRPSSNSPQSTTVIYKNKSSTEPLYGLKSKSQQDMKSIKSPREPTGQRDGLTKTRTSLVTQQNFEFKSLFLNNHCVETKGCTSSLRGTNPQSDPVPKAEGHSQSSSPTDPVPHKNSTHPKDTDPLEPSEITLTSSSNPQDRNLPQLSTGSRSDPDQVAPPSQNKSKDSSLTTTTGVTQETVFCQVSPSDRFCSNSSSQPNGVNNMSISRRSLHTVCSFHESLTSSPAQQCVHGPSMSSSSSARPAGPPQTQALAHPANLHVTLTSSLLHLLTPPKDPDICQPIVVREEIRLTPQIQGPPIPPPLPPPPQAQAESLPLGKVSRPGPPCFTRPLSQATVMEGSPVTLEVEVMGNPEPRLSWFTGGDESTSGPVLVPPSEDSELPSEKLKPPSVDLTSPPEVLAPPFMDWAPPSVVLEPHSVDSDVKPASKDSELPSEKLKPLSVDWAPPSEDLTPPLEDLVPHTVDSASPLADVALPIMKWAPLPKVLAPNFVDWAPSSVASAPPSVDLMTFSSDSLLPSLDLTMALVDSDQPTSIPDSLQLVENSPDSLRSMENSPDSQRSMENSPDSQRSMENSPDSQRSVENSPDSLRSMENSPDGDQWLGIEVFDIISEDWNTWFGTLCVLLWLIYLILL